MDVLKRMTIEHWYKLLIGVGTAVFFVALTLPLQGVPNIPVMQISLAAAFFGLGEWRNHPLQQSARYHPVVGTYKVTGYPRRWTLIGTAFDLLAAALAARGLWGLMK